MKRRVRQDQKEWRIYSQNSEKYLLNFIIYHKGNLRGSMVK